MANGSGTDSARRTIAERAGQGRGPRARVWGFFVCAAVVAMLAFTWMTHTAPQRVRPAPDAVVPPRPGWGMHPALAPTADDEGDGFVLLARSAPAGSRIKPSGQPAQPEPGRATRPHRPPSRQTARLHPLRSASRTIASPSDPAPPRDPERSRPTPSRAPARPQHTTAQAVERPSSSLAPGGQAGRGQASALGADGEGTGSGGAVGISGSAPGTGGPTTGQGATGTGGGGSAAVGAMAGPPQLVPPRVIASAGTAYPDEAFRLTVKRQDLGSAMAVEGAEGAVRVRAMVRADGTANAVEVTASSGSAVLDRAAVEAVRRWSFAPATRNGVPLDAYVTLTIRYVVR